MGARAKGIVPLRTYLVSMKTESIHLLLWHLNTFGI